MKILMFTLLSLLPLSLLAADQQAELDRACETARQQTIAPLKQQYIAECVDQGDKSVEQCQQFYQNYGERAGKRPALFYDLPECVAAFDYLKKNADRSTK